MRGPAADEDPLGKLRETTKSTVHDDQVSGSGQVTVHELRRGEPGALGVPAYGSATSATSATPDPVAAVCGACGQQLGAVDVQAGSGLCGACEMEAS